MEYAGVSEASLEGEHWSFALALYNAPGVAEACLSLQDRYGLDVNLLLVALFAAARRGQELDGATLATLDTAVAPFRAGVIQPLRAIRRGLKNYQGPQAAAVAMLRAGIKRGELQAEQVQQALLVDHLPPPPPSSTAVNLHAVARRVLAHFTGQPGPGDEAEPAIATILGGIAAVSPGKIDRLQSKDS
jgi:uncharacterized protein (TIGR02444 family)